jgi:hypothetical protein
MTEESHDHTLVLIVAKEKSRDHAPVNRWSYIRISWCIRRGRGICVCLAAKREKLTGDRKRER